MMSYHESTDQSDAQKRELIQPEHKMPSADTCHYNYLDIAGTDMLGNIIGKSSVIQKARFLISTHSQYDAPVLITGETGTGKELAARGLHYSGPRSSKPFIPVNCATFSDELFMSELFGHVKGSFTDAKRDKRGLLAVAEKGTLFLDEIDSLSLKSQAALLRFLQENEYRPVGSETSYSSNVRLIASANCDLEQRIKKGTFRADLYYRLYILSVHMPPLRERVSDIPVLIEHFIQEFHYQYALGIKVISPGLLNILKEQAWLGNIRELENLVHRLYLCSMTNVIDIDMLPYVSSMFTDNVGGQGSLNVPTESRSSNVEASGVFDGIIERDSQDYNFSKDKRDAVEIFEKSYVEQIMKKTGGNVTLAAKMCGKERRAFGKLVKKYHIKSHSVLDG